MKYIQSAWWLVLFSAALEVYSAFALKNYPLTLETKTLFSVIDSPFILFALFAYALAPFLWLLALKKLDISLAYPALIGINIFLANCLGYVVLDEAISFNKIVGSMLLFSGLSILQANPRLRETSKIDQFDRDGIREQPSSITQS